MTRIADYELGEWLGDGNHGSFYRTRPPPRLGVDHDLIAIKVIDGRATDDEFRRFENELRIFASVRSPYLVGLLDAGHDGGRLYYAMEYFPRGSLGQPTEPPDRPTVFRAVADAARGAHALHEVGVAHRDIKPDNVMLVDGGGRLSDLGLAQVLNPGQTVTGRGPIGSIEYMEPGMVRGEQASRASDVWALGATLHKALCGRSVFGEIPTADVLSALRHILQTEPQVDPSLPGDVAAVIRQCLAAAEERPATAEELADRIEALTT